MLKSLISFVLGVVLTVLAGAGAYAAVKEAEAVKMPTGTPTERPSGEGWIDLLSPEHAGGWKNADDDAKIFEIVDGQLHIFGAKPMRQIAWMPEAFGDFTMHLEFKLAKGTNSGVFFRSDPKDPVYKGFEVQVLDDAGKLPNKNGSGSIYDVATPMFNLARPAGEWNSYDITCQGSNVTVVVNGWKVLDVDLSKLTMPVGKFATPLATLPQSGHILLQDHGGAIWYRNVVVKKL